MQTSWTGARSNTFSETFLELRKWLLTCKERGLHRIKLPQVQVEVVSNNNYLGVQLDDKLDRSGQMESVYKKSQSRIFS